MKVVIARPFGGYKVGQEFEWGDGMARVLIARGLVKPAGDEVEVAAVESRSEKAMQPVSRRKFK